MQPADFGQPTAMFDISMHTPSRAPVCSLSVLSPPLLMFISVYPNYGSSSTSSASDASRTVFVAIGLGAEIEVQETQEGERGSPVGSSCFEVCTVRSSLAHSRDSLRHQARFREVRHPRPIGSTYTSNCIRYCILSASSSPSRYQYSRSDVASSHDVGCA